MCSAQVKLPVWSGRHPGQPRRQPNAGLFRADAPLPTGCHWEEQNRNQSSLQTAWRRLSAGRKSLTGAGKGDALPGRPAPRPLRPSGGAAAGLLVPRQERHAGEGLGAALALVLLGVRVRLQVGPQVGAVGEGPAAVRAGVGLLTWGRGGRQVSDRLQRPEQPCGGWPQARRCISRPPPRGSSALTVRLTPSSPLPAPSGSVTGALAPALHRGGHVLDNLGKTAAAKTPILARWLFASSGAPLGPSVTSPGRERRCRPPGSCTHPPKATVGTVKAAVQGQALRTNEDSRVLQATSNQGDQGFGQSPSVGTLPSRLTPQV